MSRRPNDFPRKVKIAAIKRATDAIGVIRCEGCGGVAKDLRVDHKIAASLDGPATLENAQVLGKCCWETKDKRDTTVAAKVTRIEAKRFGVQTKPRQTLKSRGFAKAPKVRAPLTKIAPRRGIYIEDKND